MAYHSTSPDLTNTNVPGIAEKYGKTAANVVLKWHMQLGGALVTKSVTPERSVWVPSF